MLGQVYALKCAFSVGMSVFVSGLCAPPLPVYPIVFVFRHPRLPDGRIHCVCQLWNTANKLGQRSQVLTDLKNLAIQIKKILWPEEYQNMVTSTHQHKSARLIVCPQSGNPEWAPSLRRELCPRLCIWTAVDYFNLCQYYITAHWNELNISIFCKY